MDAVVLGSGPGLLLLLGLAVSNCVGAGWNVTADYGVKMPLCSSPEDCADNITLLRRRGHFSKCPEEYKHYCVKGRCRYVMAEETPACVSRTTLIVQSRQALLVRTHTADTRSKMYVCKRCDYCGGGRVDMASLTSWQKVSGCPMKILGIGTKLQKGYTGARCERVDIFYLRGDQGQAVVICLIVAMVALVGLIICICTCSHHCRKRRRRSKEEEMETLEKELPTKQEDVLETDIA